jgi:hypothetical protein
MGGFELWGNLYSGSSPLNSCLRNKLCTFLVTGAEFVPQPTYICFTCMKTMGISESNVCASCAEVCHQGHDLQGPVISRVACECGPRGAHCCRTYHPDEKHVTRVTELGVLICLLSINLLFPSAESIKADD